LSRRLVKRLAIVRTSFRLPYYSIHSDYILFITADLLYDKEKSFSRLLLRLTAIFVLYSDHRLALLAEQAQTTMGKKASGGRVRIKQVGGKAPAMVNPMADLMVPPPDQIYLPPKPDTNTAIVWPIAESFTLQYTGFSVIWPNYLDSTKSVKRGRRIAASAAVDTPTVTDISQALQSLNMKHVVQPYKGYPRDPESQWDNLGRVLVDMTAKDSVEMDSTGVFDADDIPDMSEGDDVKKRQLLQTLARVIPELPQRKMRLERQALEDAAMQKKVDEEAALHHKIASAAAAASTGGGGNNKKKKGKKGRK
jgi:signal recognition particle subunit SRP19